MLDQNKDEIQKTHLVLLPGHGGQVIRTLGRINVRILFG